MKLCMLVGGRCVGISAFILTVGLGAAYASAVDYFVDPAAPSGGDPSTRTYPTIQQAVNAITGQTATSRATVYIKTGTYTEASTLGVTISKPFVSLVGEGASPGDVR